MANPLARLYSSTLSGVNAKEVIIEATETPGLSRFTIVGLPDTAVKESRDRVFAALTNSGFKRPVGVTTVNLAPANVKKEGPGLDLAIALAIVALKENLDPIRLRQFSVLGELALNGEIRTVRGALPAALEARDCGRGSILLPTSVAAQASVVKGIEVFGVNTLREAFEILIGARHACAEPHRAAEFFRQTSTYGMDFIDVRGQSHVKRALEVAVAGGHNILMIGPPGTGKSMLAKRIPTIMPPMIEEEAIDTTTIHSVSGQLNEGVPFVATRPFRSPHHTVSEAGLLGGGSNPGPGEVSLAHNGVLFLDELPEFRRNTLEVMRQPLEDGKVTISRAAGSHIFPARFMLVAAMNPCPCGYYGHPKRECRCPPAIISKYRQRISGPLLDRIDLHIEVPVVTFDELTGKHETDSSKSMRNRVLSARHIQTKRFENERGSLTNSVMTPKLMKRHCAVDQNCLDCLESAMHQFSLSARAHDRILKVARTIADLADHSSISESDVLEAIQYRGLDRTLW